MTRQTHEWSALTDIGRVRTHNEDSVLAQPPLFVVADGLGGHEAGEVASSIAVETLRDHAPRRPDAPALARAVKAANRAVLRAAKEGVGRVGMGTTMTAAIVEGTRVAIAHVGDSRAYLLHDGRLERLTEDHSMVADMIRRGQLTEEESRVHPNRSVITRALGTDSNMTADAFEVDAEPGDRLLLCSDGLTSMLEDARIGEVLGAYRDPTVVGQALIAEANEAGGHDNISVIVIDIEGAPAGGERHQGRGWLAVLGWVLAFALIVAGIGYGVYRYARSRAFLAIENGSVVIFRGVPGDIAGLSLSWREAATPLTAEDVERLPLSVRRGLERGVPTDSVAEAMAVSERYLELARPSAVPTDSAPGADGTSTDPVGE